MIVDIKHLKHQIHRAEKLYTDFMNYARGIGCRVNDTEIVANDEQARLLANWWTDKMCGHEQK
jgi:hypothetical protein